MSFDQLPVMYHTQRSHVKLCQLSTQSPRSFSISPV